MMPTYAMLDSSDRLGFFISILMGKALQRPCCRLCMSLSSSCRAACEFVVATTAFGRLCQGSQPSCRWCGHRSKVPGPFLIRATRRVHEHKRAVDVEAGCFAVMLLSYTSKGPLRGVGSQNSQTKTVTELLGPNMGLVRKPSAP